MGDFPLPGAHGGDGLAVAAWLGLSPTEILDLSASMNPVAPPIAPLLSKYLDEMSRYPDPTEATAAMATALGIDPDRVVLTNGGAEAIALVARHLGRGWVEPPDFSLYARHLPLLDPAGPLFASNPNNPTGRLADASSKAAVWDEAFYPLSTGRWSRGDAESGSWVVGSLTKLFACPGLRAGYVIAPDAKGAMAIRDAQPCWSVNGLVCSALAEMLESVDLVATATKIAQLRSDLYGVLDSHGLVTEPSDANYVIVREAPGLRRRLGLRGVVVRDLASFGIEDAARIGVPDADGLERLDRALGELG